ncbi:MAG: hypothetical protein AB7Q45_15040, partial [Planctomycetaceae bacterium]
VIARCGQQVRPRPLAETRQQQAERDELVCRRRQLVAHRTAAMNRRHRAAVRSVLSMAALAAQKFNPVIRRFAGRLAQGTPP